MIKKKTKKLPKRLVKRSMKEHFEYLERREAILEKIDAFYRGYRLVKFFLLLFLRFACDLQNLFELRSSNNS